MKKLVYVFIVLMIGSLLFVSPIYGWQGDPEFSVSPLLNDELSTYTPTISASICLKLNGQHINPLEIETELDSPVWSLYSSSTRNTDSKSGLQELEIKNANKQKIHVNPSQITSNNFLIIKLKGNITQDMEGKCIQVIKTLNEYGNNESLISSWSSNKLFVLKKCTTGLCDETKNKIDTFQVKVEKLSEDGVNTTNTNSSLDKTKNELSSAKNLLKNRKVLDAQAHLRYSTKNLTLSKYELINSLLEEINSNI
ncbi:MAG TPA: hypothetical protein O0X14_03280, partial [Methanocorpusculum sp.]|nr:hypothetical protein [Methanocorpusculum sp.]